MALLIDTNVLVYRHDPREPAKQQRATDLLRDCLASGEARIPHQAVIEFVAATTRPLGKSAATLLSPAEAAREAEELMVQFPLLLPTPGQMRLALKGWAAYGLSWFDAHLWSYAEFYGLETLYSEDFQHGRLYGSVRVIDPFTASQD